MFTQICATTPQQNKAPASSGGLQTPSNNLHRLGILDALLCRTATPRGLISMPLGPMVKGGSSGMSGPSAPNGLAHTTLTEQGSHQRAMARYRARNTSLYHIHLRDTIIIVRKLGTHTPAHATLPTTMSCILRGLGACAGLINANEL